MVTASFFSIQNGRTVQNGAFRVMEEKRYGGNSATENRND